MAGKSTRLRLPQVPLPRLGQPPRNPPGWGRATVSLNPRKHPAFNAFRDDREPAGDPPPWWLARYPAGTKPEWAVWWGLTANDLEPDLDFTFQGNLPGAGVNYLTTTDYLVPFAAIAIEVQGSFWHYGQGSDKQFHDQMRAAALAKAGYQAIFIDEEDALSRPKHITAEALAGRDHSRLSRKF